MSDGIFEHNEESKCWNLKLEGVENYLSRIILDFAISLEIVIDGTSETNQLVTIKIEQPFVFSDGISEKLIVPEPGEMKLGSLSGLISKSVKQISAFESEGNLLIKFRAGDEIRIPADEGFEAWTLAGPNGLVMVCTPGGTISVWADS